MKSSTDRVRLKVHVKTMRPQPRLIVEPDGTLTLHVTAAPDKGKANREIVKLLAKKLGAASSQVRIVSGLHSNLKMIQVNGISKTEIARLLELDPELLTEN
ncbi:MAG TPA: DUF167 family protein [Candidatus Acidoferrales bacterium]|nr:DUF167 family protein [Candidatus Acidoferrales bacterium]